MELETNCYKCIHRGTIPGDCHSRCLKPDPDMEGNAHGIKHGWFAYPWNFDPIWRESECANFEVKPEK